LLLSEPFVVTVETPVRITMELFLLPMQRAVLAFPWKDLFWIPNTLQYIPYFIKTGSAIQKLIWGRDSQTA
jgi:hypothetical protein